MAVRRAGEFRSMTLADLHEEFRGQKRALYQLRYRLASHQLSDVKELHKTKKEIARICTIITEKEREAEVAAKADAAATEGGETSQ
jgi:large subunit ribosomal protein L29